MSADNDPCVPTDKDDASRPTTFDAPEARMGAKAAANPADTAPSPMPGPADKMPTARPRPSDAAMSGRVATAVLIFLAAFVAVFVWIAA